MVIGLQPDAQGMLLRVMREPVNDGARKITVNRIVESDSAIGSNILPVPND